MNKIALFFMRIVLKNAIKKQKKVDNTIVSLAYNSMIKNYKHTIMFLSK